MEDAMNRIVWLVTLVLTLANAAEAQNLEGPKLNRAFIDLLAATDSKPAIVTADYNLRLFQKSRAKLVMLGFVDLEPRQERAFLFTNHSQVLMVKTSIIGLLTEEGASRRGGYLRLGPLWDLNQTPGVQRATKQFARVISVSWIKALHGADNEIKVYLQSRDLSLGKLGKVGTEGVYRFRYGAGMNLMQPQITYEAPKLPWLRGLVEFSILGDQLTTYLGMKLDFTKLF